MGALLALTSALVYGVVDFLGGLLSRRAPFRAVTFLGQAGGLLLAAVTAWVMSATSAAPADLAWGALSGVGSGLAMLFLNRGLSRGAMSVVVPVSAVTSVVLSVLCGVLLLGDRPGPVAWAGIAAAVPALWLVAGGAATSGSGVRDGLLASAGVAVQYLALGQAGPDSGLWPVAAGRVAAVLLLLPGAVRRPPRLRPGPALASLLVGAGAALGLILYLLATQRQLLSVAVVLASLYPAVPVVLGLAVLRERVAPRQAVGLLGAAVATVLLSLG
ncbi:EamA family transporter [Streptomyces sp. NPDC014006]|uniref:EamA family transporter n=1 Tax=Streptomyces sp. NPDC014006 TaxID=3364870 RepID=UPI0036F9E411